MRSPDMGSAPSESTRSSSSQPFWKPLPPRRGGLLPFPPRESPQRGGRDAPPPWDAQPLGSPLGAFWGASRAPPPRLPARGLDRSLSSADHHPMPQSRAKGSRGEREAAAAWTAATGLIGERTAQRTGKTGLPDITVGISSLHCEVKRRARLGCSEFMRQAERDARQRIPFVLMREDGDSGWLAMVRLENLVQLAEALVAARREPLL